HLADVMDQEQAGLDFTAVALAVDRHLDWQFHDSSSGNRRVLSGARTPPPGATEGENFPPAGQPGARARGGAAARPGRAGGGAPCRPSRGWGPAGRGAPMNYWPRRRRPSTRAWSSTSRTGSDFSRAMRATSANSGVTVTIRSPRRETLNGMVPYAVVSSTI